MQAGHVADEALEALSSGLGKREADPEEKKPAVDKVKVEKYSDLKKCFVGIHIFIVSVFPQAKLVGGVLTLFKKRIFTCETSCVLIRKF